MFVTLVRHGAAGQAPVDEVRALTEAGRNEAVTLGRALAQRGVRFDRVLVSPLVRARQTAEHIAACVEFTRQIEEDARLEPEASPGAVLDLVCELEHAGAREVALVAHMPIIARVAGALVGGAEPGFRTGQALRLEVHAGRARSSAGPADWLP